MNYLGEQWEGRSAEARAQVALAGATVVRIHVMSEDDLWD